MQRSLAVGGGVLLVMAAVFTLGTAAAPKEEGRGAGVFPPLVKGQRVSLRERAGGYEVGLVLGVPLGHRVVEVGPDYLVLEDVAGVMQTRIPVYAVRAVTVTRIPGKR